MFRILPLCVAFALLACSSTPPNNVSLTSERSSDRVVVAPLNLALRMPVEIEAVQEPVWKALLSHFEARDRAVQQIDPKDARALWAGVVNELGDERELTLATSTFARELAEHSNYDLLVMPALVVRRAAVRGNFAYWDGVRRRISVDSPWDGNVSEIGHAGDVATVRGMNGQLAGASLYVVVLTPDGEAVYEGLGGLDLLHQAEIARDAKRGDWRAVLRDAPFASADNLQEGIGVALERKLPRTARAW